MTQHFESSYQSWLEQHMHDRSGTPFDRLRDGQGYLEKLFLTNIWWPAFGTLDGLVPEYEVRDYKDGRRYIDHAYKPDHMKLALEADGFNPHIRDVGRWEHADNLLRDAHLIADGWTVLHFSSDVIKFRPREAQQLLRQIVWGREGWAAANSPLTMSLAGREAIRFVRAKGGVMMSAELRLHLGVSRNTVRKVIGELVGAGFLRPVDATKKYTRSYELTAAGRELML